MMGTLVGTGTRLFIGEKGQRTGATVKKGAQTEWGIEGRKERRPFRSALIICIRYSPFFPTNEPGLSQYLKKQKCCERCLNGVVGNATSQSMHLFCYLLGRVRSLRKTIFPMLFFRLVFSLVAVFISFACLLPTRQMDAVRKKIEKNLDFVEESFMFCS